MAGASFLDETEPRRTPKEEVVEAVYEPIKPSPFMAEFLGQAFKHVTPYEETLAYMEQFVVETKGLVEENRQIKTDENNQYYKLSIPITKARKVLVYLEKYSGVLITKIDGDQSTLRDIVMTEEHVIFTNYNSGGGKHPQHHMHNKNQIVAEQTGHFTNVNDGVRQLLIPPHRAKDILGKVFAYYMKDNDLLNKFSKHTIKERTKIPFLFP